MSTEINIGILGATSYTGCELVTLLNRHSRAKAAWVSSKSYAGKKLSEIYPRLKGIFKQELVSPEKAVQMDADVVFSCLPHAVSAELCLPFIKKGIKIIDLSADFRLKDRDVYESWYKTEHPAPELLKEAVYGLPEIYRQDIKETKICANPGCYPTSILIPLLPVLKTKNASLSNIIADCKTGVSGAGRKLKLMTHFVEANENLSPYAIGQKHRHLPELKQELKSVSGGNMEIIFSPHLTPVNRGMLSTIYMNTEIKASELTREAQKLYQNEPFVRIKDDSSLPDTSSVMNTNYCDISYSDGLAGKTVIACSAIDNLSKGASGQALQNMNIMFGCDETDGLKI